MLCSNLSFLPSTPSKCLQMVYRQQVKSKLIKIKQFCYSPQAKYTSPHFTLFTNNLPILSRDKAKYLGVFINSHLNFNSRIKSVENKVASSVGILLKLKHSFPSSSLLKLYYGLFT